MVFVNIIVEIDSNIKIYIVCFVVIWSPFIDLYSECRTLYVWYIYKFGYRDNSDLNI